MENVGSRAHEVFNQLIIQADELNSAAEDGIVQGSLADSCRRAAFLFYIAGIDSFFGEIATEVATRKMRDGADQDYCSKLSNFLGVSKEFLQGPQGEGYISYYMSFKTFLDPGKIDSMVEAVFSETKPQRMWRHAAVLCGQSDKVLQAELSLKYDRRNKIAHEGDWDRIQYVPRPIHSHDVLGARKTALDVTQGALDWVRSRID